MSSTTYIISVSPNGFSDVPPSVQLGDEIRFVAAGTNPPAMVTVVATDVASDVSDACLFGTTMCKLEEPYSVGVSGQVSNGSPTANVFTLKAGDASTSITVMPRVVEILIDELADCATDRSLCFDVDVIRGDTVRFSSRGVDKFSVTSSDATTGGGSIDGRALFGARSSIDGDSNTYKLSLGGDVSYTVLYDTSLNGSASFTISAGLTSVRGGGGGAEGKINVTK